MLSITVNTLSDEDDGINVGGISLRDAINAAAPSGDTIDFDLNVPELNGGTITLEHGEIPFSKPITIDAHLLTSGITIDAGNGTDHIAGTGDGSRIFNITAPSVTMIGVTLTGGDVSGDGGAIRTTGSLELQNSKITGNAATFDGVGYFGGRGGGIYFSGQYAELSLQQDSVISGNTANAGGGIFAGGYANTLNIQSSHITGNDSLTVGGGILSYCRTLTLRSSEISGNYSHSTRYGSNLGGGGGLWANVFLGSATIDQSTFDNNKSTGYSALGAGAYISSFASPVTITETIISGNQAIGTEDANTGGLHIAAYNGSNVLIDRSTITGNDTVPPIL